MPVERKPVTGPTDTAFYDLAIVGSGFGGSLLAMIARRLGLSVLLLERGQHPRFAIGESTSPLTNLLIEELAQRYDLPRLLPLTTYGSWQESYPEVACGLKRGFTYYRHDAGRPFRNAVDRSDQLLVAASPNDAVADTHWFRADVDAFFLQEAIAAGAVYRDRVLLAPPIWEGETALLHGERREARFSDRARLIVDATGPRGYLSRALSLAESEFPGYPATQALYSHFTSVRRTETLSAFHRTETPPYPPDDAALHHVFDGGWMWVLRVGNGITSAGISVTDALAAELRLSEGEPAWRRFLTLYPTIGEQFAEAEAVQPFFHTPRLSFRTSAASGPGWVMLPSAAAFVDPLFSTGFPLTLLGIERLARLLEESWGTASLSARLADFGRTTLEEVDTTAKYVGACYTAFPCFSRFAALSMLYFAAASYSEMARRLQRPDRPRRYLAADLPEFGAALRALSLAERQTAPTGDFDADVAAAVDSINVAGLCDPAKRNWYDVDLQDVVAAAPKLGLSPNEMRSLLRTAPWAQPNSL